jgi:hypothetical protein
MPADFTAGWGAVVGATGLFLIIIANIGFLGHTPTMSGVMIVVPDGASAPRETTTATAMAPAKTKTLALAIEITSGGSNHATTVLSTVLSIQSHPPTHSPSCTPVSTHPVSTFTPCSHSCSWTTKMRRDRR